MSLTVDEINAHVHGLVHILRLNEPASVCGATLAASPDVARAIDGQLRRLYHELGPAGATSILATFAAWHLHTLVVAYKATPDHFLVTPYTIMLAALVDRGQFARFTRTQEGRNLLKIQAKRFAGVGLPRQVEEIRNVTLLFNYFVVYSWWDQNQACPYVPSEYANRIFEKADAYRRLCFSKMPDPCAKQTFSMLTETTEFLQRKQSPGKMLGAAGAMMPLGSCGDVESGCWSTGSVAPLHCSRCESVRYCGPAHQRSHWADHRAECVRPVWL